MDKHGIVADNDTIAEGPGFKITAKELKFYKANEEASAKLQNQTTARSNSDLLKDLIEKQLVIQYAKDQGLSVSKEEVTKYIEQLRIQLNQASTPQDIKDLKENRIRISGLTENEYWTSAETLKNYENFLLITKLTDKLTAEGKLKNPQDYKNFQDKLWNQSQSKIKIDNEKLSNVNK